MTKSPKLGWRRKENLIYLNAEHAFKSTVLSVRESDVSGGRMRVYILPF